MYFKNLSTIRFLAASLVIIHHLEHSKEREGFSNLWDTGVVQLAGKLGVIIFFALSGFLITYQLLQKKEGEGINFKDFYWRRALRIMPLYLVMVLLALFVLPRVPLMHIPGAIDPFEQLGLNLALLPIFPHVQLYWVGPIAYESQFWSIGVEENFYFIIAPLVFLAGYVERFRLAIIAGLLGFIALKVAYYVLPGSWPGVWRLKEVSYFMSNYFQLDCMAFGGLLATLHFTGTGRRLLTHWSVQLATYALFVGFALRGTRFLAIAEGALYWDFYASTAALLLYNLVQDTSLLHLEYKWLTKLGSWSYGIYVWHLVLIIPLVKVLGGTDWLLYPSVFGGTIALSWLSFTYFEKPLLDKHKDRFARKQSGPMSKQAA